MASMRWNFLQVYTKVADFLGSDITDSDDLATAKDIVYRGYMKFLMPVSPKDEEIYVWSWLRQPWKMALEPNKWEYPLPKDFDRFYRKIEYDGVADGTVCRKFPSVLSCETEVTWNSPHTLTPMH
ncbi:hypothetical protein LCGC14_3019780 [marine sediment metagenome]|uniref:Uncharacterized protein n=1 Tax=marine sediment metagenome TaxID=412755 RepID=A0A0F8Z3A5_9ZZZZ